MTPPPRVDFDAIHRVFQCFVYLQGQEQVGVVRLPHYHDLKTVEATVRDWEAWVQHAQQAAGEVPA